jgi:hypothetical protein
MKRKIPLMALLAIIILLLGAGVAQASAARYNLSWWTVDGGGGRNSGSHYALTGGVGQPDAGRLSGSKYHLQGGFWSGPHFSSPQNGLFLPNVHR